MSFQQDFVWGAATASYQVEGAAYEDGKGLSIWDVFCKEPGKIYQGQTGDTACDQYHLYKEDISLMKKMGIRAYRFSISWARIQPDGTGPVNPLGVAYYNRLIDELLANDIVPYLTLFHWDLPYALQTRGGFLNDEMITWFADYSAFVADYFSDRVTHFITFNEPQCFLGLGYRTGEHAPGLKTGIRDYCTAIHVMLRAHGASVAALRKHARQPVQIGYAPTGAYYYPSTDSPTDIEAARQMTFDCPSLCNSGDDSCIGANLDAATWNVSLMSDPVLLGEYPASYLSSMKDYLPPITAADMELIHQPLDFYGQNIYNAIEVKAEPSTGKPEIVKRYDGFPKTAMQWPVTPACLYWAPKFLYERYKKPIYITENGISCHDWIALDGCVHDGNRIDFMQRYLQEVQHALEDGVDIAGYFAWSLLDNFEWANGYSDRFGLIYVDFATQKRIVKDSGYWYAHVIQDNHRIKDNGAQPSFSFGPAT